MNDPARLPLPEPPQHAGHETTDVSPSYVGLFALGLVIMIALAMFVLGRIFWRLEAAAERNDPPQSPLAGDETPPPPRLQEQPATDLARLRREEDRKLTSYGWIDQKQRLVRMPIDRAIEVLAERGLPEPRGLPESKVTRQPPQETERRP